MAEVSPACRVPTTGPGTAGVAVSGSGARPGLVPPEHPSSPQRAALLASLAPLSWGGAYVVTRSSLPEGDPLLLAALRALPAGVVLLALGPLWPPRRAWWGRVLVLAALDVAVCNACVVFAAQRLPSGVAATLSATQPLAMALVAAAASGRLPQRSALVAGGVGVVGVGLLTAASSTALDPLAVAAGLGSVVAMSVGMHLGARWARPVPLTTFMGWQLLAGGSLLLPVAALGGAALPTLDGRTLLGLTYGSLVATALAYVAWFAAVERTSASTAAFLARLTPVVAAGAGALFLDEGLTVVPGGGLVLGRAARLAAQRPAPEAAAEPLAGAASAAGAGAPPR